MLQEQQVRQGQAVAEVVGAEVEAEQQVRRGQAVAEVVGAEVEALRRELLLRVKGQQEHRVGRMVRVRRRQPGAGAAMAGLEVAGVLLLLRRRWC